MKQTMRNGMKAVLMLLVALLSVLVVGCQKQEETTGDTGTQQSQPQSGN